MSVKVLFVCLGNICRSPTAHAVMQQKSALAGLALEIESAGTAASTRAQRPDVRSVDEGNAAGYDFAGIMSRPVMDKDFAHYDMILAMDESNLNDLQQRCPHEYRHKIGLFMQFHPDYPRYSEVPDPYYGGRKGFALVLQMIEAGCDGLCRYLRQERQPQE